VNHSNPAFILAHLLKASGGTVDVDKAVEMAEIWSGDVLTGSVGDVDAFIIGLWAHLARRGIVVVDFRLRGLRWEAQFHKGGWHLVADLLDGQTPVPAFSGCAISSMYEGDALCPA
jgi:hypothetical protein